MVAIVSIIHAAGSNGWRGGGCISRVAEERRSSKKRKGNQSLTGKRRAEGGKRAESQKQKTNNNDDDDDFSSGVANFRNGHKPSRAKSQQEQEKQPGEPFVYKRTDPRVQYCLLLLVYIYVAFFDLDWCTEEKRHANQSHTESFQTLWMKGEIEKK